MTSRFLANLLATVFMLLDLNQIMSVIFNVPAAVGSTVSALNDLHCGGDCIILIPEIEMLTCYVVVPSLTSN